MKRILMLSEIIKDLQKYLEENRDCEVRSIGTSSGSNSSFIFHTKSAEQEDINDIHIKCVRK